MRWRLISFALPSCPWPVPISSVYVRRQPTGGARSLWQHPGLNGQVNIDTCAARRRPPRQARYRAYLRDQRHRAVRVQGYQLARDRHAAARGVAAPAEGRMAEILGQGFIDNGHRRAGGGAPARSAKDV